MPELIRSSRSPSSRSALAAAARRSRYPRRNEAILLFLLDTGARASEFCDPRMRDVNPPERHCTVTGKRNKRRTLFSNSPTVRSVSAYLPDTPRSEDAPLFMSASKGPGVKPLTRSGPLQLTGRLGDAAGTEAVRCSPHTFRHTFGVSFIRNGGNTFSLM
ncbi:MAG TPA: site-specific integrase [Armatimonadota bacterium]|nr:site-specific integrase [Armatimonadota bacterium]